VKNPNFPPFSLMRASVYLIIQLGQSSNLMLPKIYADKTMVKLLKILFPKVALVKNTIQILN
jgi:hypothetical protein